MFETLALVFSDAVISALMEAKKEGAPELKGGSLYGMRKPSLLVPDITGTRVFPPPLLPSSIH